MDNLQTKIICYFLFRIYKQLGGAANFRDIMRAAENKL